MTPATGTAAARLGAQPLLLTVTGAAALLVNLAVYAAGRTAGVEFDVVSFIGNRPETVGPRAIAVMTVVPWLVGGVLLELSRRNAATVWPWLGWSGVALAVVMVPFFNDAEPVTKLTLAVMHLVVGSMWFAAVHHLARQRRLLGA
ncbi:DUF6069 family protein [Jiangella alkaliphila]|uniref:Uncharacterized protein n=1 Tax=Jiangella alkaliphila TaxID=419479 RepID=A0A1H2H2H9_9ACTN|nr:DUF6069 family protein [Jiangella alkaliphila]SDU25995.1 hypothetical protein SAMN04488563_0803 [Jiangella alkaliphila]